MNYDIKLYVHGVPSGQDAWGVSDYDSNYIESFYGRKSDAPVQMFVEVKQFGTHANCYYTYIRTGNVCGNSGRTGSYIALTLRMNYYYADMKNMYNLLDAAYNKFLLGTVLAANGGETKFLVSNFAQANTTLVALDQEIQKYLMQFSTNSDFLSLNGFKANGQNRAANFNLLECEDITTYVRNNSNVAISSLFPSTREQRAMQQMNNQIAAINANAEQQIASVRQKAKTDVENVRKEKEAAVQTIKNEYKDADRTINSLRQEIIRGNEERNRLQTNIAAIRNELNEALQYKTQYEATKLQLDQANKALHGIKKSISGLDGVEEISEKEKGQKRKSHVISEDKPYAPSAPDPQKQKHSFMKLLKDFNPLMTLLILLISLISLILLGIMAMKGCTSESNPDNEQIEDLYQESKEVKECLTESQDKTSEFNHAEDDTKDVDSDLFAEHADAKIDIQGISSTKPMKPSQPYSISLQMNGKAIDLGGEWVSEDFTITSNTIVPKRAGRCTIEYRINGKVFKTRDIDVDN